MGYLDNQIGYPNDILASRAIIKKDNYAIIPPNGVVCNIIPGFTDCNMTILSTPKLGASFVDYVGTLFNEGGNLAGFGGGKIECIIYVIEGELIAYSDKDEHKLSQGGYLYCPAGVTMRFKNNNKGEPSKIFLYKRVYEPIEGHKAHVVCGNVNELPKIDYEGMHNVHLQDLLPKDLGFDMNIHILTFQPGASHGYIETHYQEHGALILSGKGMYNLDNDWVPVKKDDYIFMASYALQAGYAVGDEEFSYIYSKDCNRDIEL